MKQLVTEHRSVLEKIMYKYRRDVQRLILMDKEESKAINLFNTSLAQVIHSMNQYYLYKKIYHLSGASLITFFSRVNRKLMGRK